MEYNEADFLQLSGIQHFTFCRRQWALIHIENQWADNFRTVDGTLMHENAHDREFEENRGATLIRRGVSVYSAELGISGQCDVLEYRKSDNGIPLPGRDGLWQPYPVEYKRGKPKEDAADELQLCAQAMCLESMLCCDVPEGALYYGEIRRRIKITFSEDLRSHVTKLLSEMHELFSRGYTPKVKPSKACSACSLKELCLPKLMKNTSVSSYLKESMESTQ